LWKTPSGAGLTSLKPSNWACLVIGKPINAEHQRIRERELKNCQLRGDVDILKKSLDLLCA